MQFSLDELQRRLVREGLPPRLSFLMITHKSSRLTTAGTAGELLFYLDQRSLVLLPA